MTTATVPSAPATPTRRAAPQLSPPPRLHTPLQARLAAYTFTNNRHEQPQPLAVVAGGI